MKNLGMGMMRLPLLDENDFANIDYEQVNQMVDAFMDAIPALLKSKLQAA